ncbi:alanine:cation symporter family protein [Alphaproteobacteria bacterium]|nr:alanine:cation symporter family protein [Alphaproteobacteria bacterium]
MYYLRDVFAKRGMTTFGKGMGIFYALCAVLGTIGAASLFQTNQVFKQIVNITGGSEASVMADKGWLFGLFMVFIVGLVIVGGIKSIARVTSKIVPIMGAVYLCAGLIVIAIFYQNIPAAFVTIFQSALTPEAGFGAVIGALLMGVQRAAFSNEAGFGTAAIAHSAVKTNDPVSQGLVGMLGPFIDTVIICLVTALVITVTGAYSTSDGMEGIMLTSRAFEMAFPWMGYVLFAVVFLFAYSTLISWSYYGQKSFAYLFGNSAPVDWMYKLGFLGFIIVGASSNLESVINFTDAAVFAMTIPNIIGLYLLAPEVRADLKTYWAKIK